MTLKRSGAPLDPGPLSIVLLPSKKINSTTLQEDRTGSVARQERVTGYGGADIEGEVQGDSGWTFNGAAILSVRPGQVEIPADSRADVTAYSFWKRGTTTMFDIRIFNLDAGSCLSMTPQKYIAKVEKEKKDLYIQACLERRSNFTPMIYSADRINGAGALAAKKRLAALLSYKVKQEYSEMCGFVRARISLAIVRSNIRVFCTLTNSSGDRKSW